jgi:deazaflavin-dependent oxidoreductase (nitroreductase family)
MPHGDDDVVVYPSNGGKQSPPAWWLNLQATPSATIQIGNTTRQIQARPATPEEYAAIWPAAEQYNPHWRDYAKNVTRRIPLILLEGECPLQRIDV